MSVPEQCWVYYTVGIQKGYADYQAHVIFATFIVIVVLIVYSLFVIQPLWKKRGKKDES